MKRNVKAWAAKHRTQVINFSLVESLAAKIAFSAAFLLHESAVICSIQFDRLTALNEIALRDYLIDNIFIETEHSLDAEWRCSFVCTTPGFFVYLSNTLERHWRTLRNLLPKYKSQDVTHLMAEMIPIFHSKVLQK